MSNYLNCAGDYEAKASMPQGGWIGEAGEKKTPRVQIRLTVIGGSVDDGKEITWYGYLSDKAFANTVKTLVQVFGFDGDFDKLVERTGGFEGKLCRFTSDVETYEGKDRAKVKWLNPHNYTGKADVIDESKAKALSALFTKKAKAVVLEAQAEMKASSKGAPVADDSDDNDMPFN